MSLLERCFPALGRFLATPEVVPSTLVCLAIRLSSLPAVLWAAGGYWACGEFFSWTSELVRSLGGGPTAAVTQVARHGAKGACDLSLCNRPHRLCAHDFQNSDSVRGRGNLEIFFWNISETLQTVAQIVKLFKRSYFFKLFFWNEFQTLEKLWE